MLTVPREQKGVLLFGYYLVSGAMSSDCILTITDHLLIHKVSILAAITPMIYNWQASNTAGDTKKKCTSAVVFIGMCLGNIIGPL